MRFSLVAVGGDDHSDSTERANSTADGLLISYGLELEFPLIQVVFILSPVVHVILSAYKAVT